MTFLLANWRLIAIAALVAVLGGYGMTMRVQRDNARSEYAEFKAQSAKAAWQAAEKALQETITDQKMKESADAENSQALATLAGTIKRLRDEHSPGGIVSAPAACPSNPAGADRFRSESERAYRDLVEGLRAEGERSSKAVIGLNTGKRWATAK